jgi:hypothetical protein
VWVPNSLIAICSSDEGRSASLSGTKCFPRFLTYSGLRRQQRVTPTNGERCQEKREPEVSPKDGEILSEDVRDGEVLGDGTIWKENVIISPVTVGSIDSSIEIDPSL